MNRNRTARQHSFAIIPNSAKPRSKFLMRQTRKQGFNASELTPIYCEEVLPGDVWQHTESIMARLATPIAPLVDDLDLETWYFYSPNRILWPNWEDFITGTDTELVVPKVTPIIQGSNWRVEAGGALDHFGLLPQVYDANVFHVNAFPIFGMFTIWNEWFRDQNLQEPWVWSDSWTTGTSADFTQNSVVWAQQCLRVNKRHDMFTSSLPFAQKGDAVSISLGTTAPVTITGDGSPPDFTDGVNPTTYNLEMRDAANNVTTWTAVPGLNAPAEWGNPHLTGTANLASATAVTINALRLAAITQQLLELDARGGSRYVENLLAHWDVRASNRSLQRPEYLGGSKTRIAVNPIAQTAAYDAEPGPTQSNLGNLGAEMHVSSHQRTFTYAAEEHGYILGFAAVRATPTYQQGTRRHWTRTDRLDFWDPVYEGLGEQAVNTTEIFQPTDGVPANLTWGFQERGAEYRFTPNEITGPLRSTSATPMDWWHLSEEYATEPALNEDFITDKTQEVLSRCLAVDVATSDQWACQIIMDVLHEAKVARLMPAYSVPGIRYF